MSDDKTATPERGMRNCTLCRQITRDGKWDVESTLARFGLTMERFGFETTYVPCPECGEPYWCFFHEWFEDWQRETVFAFVRLDIAQARERLPEAERAAFDAEISGVIAEMERDLSGNDGFLKSEAAWRLARYYNCTEAWEDLGRLFAHPDETVFVQAFVQSFRKPEESDSPQPPPAFEPRPIPPRVSGPALLRGLESKDRDLKNLAVACTCDRAIVAGDVNAIAGALSSKDAEAAGAAIWYLTYKAGSRLDVTPLRGLLVSLVESENGYQAASALKLLLRGRKDGADPVPPFGFIVACLRHGKKEVRKEAAGEIVYWAATTSEKTQAVRELAGLLEDEDLGWAAMHKLKDWAEFGKKEVATVIPDVVAYVEAKKVGWQTGMEVLRYAMEAGMNITAIYPFIANGLGRGDRRIVESSSVILDHVLRQRVDMGRLRGDIEPGLDKVCNDSYGEQLVAILVRIYLRGRDWNSIRKLLKHPNKNVAADAALALRESEAEIGPVVPDLVENLFKDVEFARAQAVEALKRHARSGAAAANAARGAIKKALEKKNDADTGVADAKKLLESLGATPRGLSTRPSRAGED